MIGTFMWIVFLFVDVVFILVIVATSTYLLYELGHPTFYRWLSEHHLRDKVFFWNPKTKVKQLENDYNAVVGLAISGFPYNDDPKRARKIIGYMINRNIGCSLFVVGSKFDMAQKRSIVPVSKDATAPLGSHVNVDPPMPLADFIAQNAPKIEVGCTSYGQLGFTALEKADVLKQDTHAAAEYLRKTFPKSYVPMYMPTGPCFTQKVCAAASNAEMRVVYGDIAMIGLWTTFSASLASEAAWHGSVIVIRDGKNLRRMIRGIYTGLQDRKFKIVKVSEVLGIQAQNV